MSIDITRPSQAVTRVIVDSPTFRVLFTADRHWDNPKSDRSLQKKHLDWARENNAMVVDLGDLFCAMQGKGDPRGSKDDIRPEHQTGRYLNALSKTSVDWFSPYADLWLAQFYGNHETAVIKHREHDLLEAFTDGLRAKGSKVELMGYSGYVFITMRRDKEMRSFCVYCNHGYGGGGPVTKGVIQTNRRAVMIPDADILVSGHIHESWVVEIMQEKLSIRGNFEPLIKVQTHIQLPTYKEEYLAHKGFHIEKGRPPKPMGAYYVDFNYGPGRGRQSYSVHRLN